MILIFEIKWYLKEISLSTPTKLTFTYFGHVELFSSDKLTLVVWVRCYRINNNFPFSDIKEHYFYRFSATQQCSLLNMKMRMMMKVPSREWLGSCGTWPRWRWRRTRASESWTTCAESLTQASSSSWQSVIMKNNIITMDCSLSSNTYLLVLCITGNIFRYVSDSFIASSSWNIFVLTK